MQRKRIYCTKYSAQYLVFPATFRVISRKIDNLWDSVAIMMRMPRLYCICHEVLLVTRGRISDLRTPRYTIGTHRNFNQDTVYTVQQGESNLLFFNIFIIRQTHLLSEGPKQANFRRFLDKSQAEIEWCAIVLALCRDKTIQDREPIFCRKVSILKFFLT